MLADPEYSVWGDRTSRRSGPFSAVPMLKEDELIGVILTYRQDVQPFTDKQIELVETFADQAVIAIENVRLFDEVQARTRELTESLEQQTATSEVLQVICSSPGELEPVFETMLENATRICEAKFGTMYLYEGDAFRIAALHNAAAWRCVDGAQTRTVPSSAEQPALASCHATKQVGPHSPTSWRSRPISSVIQLRSPSSSSRGART